MVCHMAPDFGRLTKVLVDGLSRLSLWGCSWCHAVTGSQRGGVRGDKANTGSAGDRACAKMSLCRAHSLREPREDVHSRYTRSYVSTSYMYLHV